MTMRPLTVPPKLATDATFASGPDTGQPTRVAMSAGELAQGFIGGARVAAAKSNWLFGSMGDWLELKAHDALQTWDKQELPVTAGGRSCLFNYLLAVGQPNIRQRAIVALGHDVNNGNRVAYMRSLGSGFFEDSVQAPTADTGPASSPVAGANGEIVLSNTVNGLQYTSLGGSPAINGGRGNGNQYYIGWSATPYVEFNSLAGFTKSAAFNSTTGASGPTISARVANVLGTPGAMFADDGAAHVILLAQCTIGGVNRFRVIHSGDGGSNWAVTLTLGAGVTSADVCWSPFWNLFFLMASNGEQWTSPDGVTWTLARTSATVTAAAGCSFRYNTLASCGLAIVKAFQPTYYGSSIFGTGVIYSFDLGATWRVQHLADSDGIGGFGFGIQTLISANGRLYATDRSRVFRSGLLSFEGTDY